MNIYCLTGWFQAFLYTYTVKKRLSFFPSPSPAGMSLTRDTVARWQKVLPKSSNVAKEKMRWQQKLSKFDISLLKVAEKWQKTIIYNNVAFLNCFTFIMKSPIRRMFWHYFLKIGRNFPQKWQNFLVRLGRKPML
jgi:hypothetical protein